MIGEACAVRHDSCSPYLVSGRVLGSRVLFCIPYLQRIVTGVPTPTDEAGVDVVLVPQPSCDGFVFTSSHTRLDVQVPTGSYECLSFLLWGVLPCLVIIALLSALFEPLTYLI